MSRPRSNKRAEAAKPPRRGAHAAKELRAGAAPASGWRRVLPWLFPAVPFLFYFATCSRTIGLGDTALLMVEMHDLALSTHVDSHNLTVILGHLLWQLPIGNHSFASNLASAVGGSIAIALLYTVLYRMTSSARAAAITASITMVSHSMWWHSTIAEVYALNAVFMVLGLGVLASLHKHYTERKLLAFFLLSGLAFFNHVQMGILLAGACTYFLVHALQLPGKRMQWAMHAAPRCLLAFILGFIPYLVLLLRDVKLDGFVHTVWQASGGQFHSIMLKGDLLRGLGTTVFLTWLQFPAFYLVAIVFGVVLVARAWRRSPSLFALLVMFGVNTMFFMTYDTWDKFAFLLPSFLMLSFAGVFAVQWALRRASGRWVRGAILALLFAVSFAAPVYLYAHLSKWGEKPGFWHSRYNNDYAANNYNQAEYIANPNKRNFKEVSTFTDLMFAVLPKNAIVVDTDSRTLYPLRYFQVYENKRPDIRMRLYNSWGFANWGLSPEGFLQLIEGAYVHRADLFIPTLDHPYAEIIAAARQQRPYDFERFPLDSTHWVYRLAVPKKN